MKLPGHGRYDYVPLDRRPTYEWPNGARLALNICNNIEHFAFGAGLGTDNAAGGVVPPNQRSYAWRDWGNRVGLWYWLDLMDELGLPASHNINSAVLEEYPEITERLVARGDELVGHGRSNAERQDGWWEDDEARMIAECTETVARLSGQRPTGWLGPYLAQSRVTLDLLKEAGYAYVQDWPADDQPFWMRTRAGPILSVPYSVELNDSPAMVFRRHTAREFQDMMVDHFDEMLRQAQKRPLVYTVAVHPFIIGQPYRLAAFRRALDHVLKRRAELWITTPGGIARHCAALPKGIIPGS
jgi:allantoinase